MPRFWSSARLYPGESFAGPDRDEVGCYTFAHLSSGRRVLLRRWREGRFELSPAGRAYFLQFPQELQVHIPCIHVLEGRVFRKKDPYMSITDEKFLLNRGAKGLGIVRVCGHATQQDVLASAQRRLTAFLETRLLPARNAFCATRTKGMSAGTTHRTLKKTKPSVEPTSSP